MSTAPAEQVRPDGEAEFAASHYDRINEANWQEMRAKGFQMLVEQVDLGTPRGQSSLKFWQDTYGREYVYTGSPFEWRERRPLDHKPGRGIYVSGEWFRLPDEEDNGSNRQPPDTGGPASSR
jgi:hypothetical protein